MTFFTAPDGTRLHYELDGDGPPLVLHLGAGCDSDLWRAAGYLEPLRSACTCILFDHRGHGKSDHPTGPGANHINRYAADVIALVEHLGYPSVSFFGWSNGVPIGLKATEQRPEFFDSLILFGPIAPPSEPAQLEASVTKRVQALRDKGWWLLLDSMLAAEKQPVPEWMVDRILVTDIEPYIAWTRDRPSWGWNAWDALPHVGQSTLMIVGELEDPDDLMAEAASKMPRAKRLRIPGKEHINAFLDSGFVVPVVSEFLRDQRASLGS